VCRARGAGGAGAAQEHAPGDGGGHHGGRRGELRDYPPTDLAGWKEFAGSLPTPELFDMVRDREPLGSIASYRFAANRHCHYERLKGFPAGYLMMGDAVCSFNPVYGQGMSVALSEARALDDCLAAGDGELASRFFREVTRIVASPWAIATGEDYRHSPAGA
jgi:2-polyprenyl-6-methoxyphenol hydroxylase-like FAD-dependent oxidoreductase